MDLLALEPTGRDPLTIDCEAEIVALFAVGGRREIICNWCGATLRTRSRDGATRWFHSHDCVSFDGLPLAA